MFVSYLAASSKKYFPYAFALSVTAFTCHIFNTVKIQNFPRENPIRCVHDGNYVYRPFSRHKNRTISDVSPGTMLLWLRDYVNVMCWDFCAIIIITTEHCRCFRYLLFILLTRCQNIHAYKTYSFTKILRFVTFQKRPFCRRIRK